MLSYQKWRQLSERGRLLKVLRCVQQAMQERDRYSGFNDIGIYLDYLNRDASGPDSNNEYLDGMGITTLVSTIRAQAQHGRDFWMALSELRLRLCDLLGIGLADWDFSSDAELDAPPDASTQTLSEPQRGSILGASHRIVFLDGLRSPFNLGSILRTSAFFGFETVVLSEQSLNWDHPRVQRSAMGAMAMVSVHRMSLAELRAECSLPLFAVELGGRKLGEFVFPPQGIMVLGNEEYGINPLILEECRQSGGVLSILGSGGKASLNVGVAFGIACAAWVGQ